ncbi:MAG: DUF4339 domain-containing protein [Pirellulales bacterium]
MASWMVRRGAKTIGPFSTKVIQDKAREGQLLPADQVKQVGQLDWRAAASIRGLFSAEAIQQAASASPQGNNVPGEDIPEALPINNQGIDAVIPEALPANMPAPPPFQKKSVAGHANTKRNLIIVSSSVGGIVLVTAIALIIIFNLPNSETDDIIPVESVEKTTVVVEEPLNPEADNAPTQTSNPPILSSDVSQNDLDSIVKQVRSNLGAGYTEPDLYLGMNTKSCYDDDFYLVNSRAAAASLAIKHLTDSQKPGWSNIKRLQENIEMLLGKQGFLKAQATVTIVEPWNISSEDKLEITLTAQVDIQDITETAPKDGEIIQYCIGQFENAQPIKYHATLTPILKDGVYYIDSHQVSGPLNEATIREVIRRNVAILISLALPAHAKKGLSKAI